jgi:hypothetical protein
MFVPIIGGAPPAPELQFRTMEHWDPQGYGTPITMPAVPLGEASASRLVVLCNVQYSYSSNSNPFSATVGGVALSAHPSNDPNGKGVCHMLYGLVPSGTSQDIVLNYATTGYYNSGLVAVYTIHGVTDPTPFDTGYLFNPGATGIDLDTPENGATIVFAHRYNGSDPALAEAHGSVQDFNQKYDTGYQFHGKGWSAVEQSAGVKNYVLSPATGYTNSCLMGACWG